MTRQRLLQTATAISAALGVLLCAAVYVFFHRTAGFLCGSALGLLCGVAALWMFFKMWRAAPDKSAAMQWYVLRLCVTLGSVLLAMVLPFVDALGVLLPQLFPMPVLAVCMTLYKGE